jgi:hypothetical protein
MDRYGGTEQQKKRVPREIPNSVRCPCSLDAEASALQIDSTRNSLDKRPQKTDQEQIGQGGGARQPPTAYDE